MPVTSGGSGGTGGAAQLVWASGVSIVAGERWFDPFAKVMFTALVNLSPSTVRPSEDPVTFVGDDVDAVGAVSAVAHTNDNLTSLIMSPGRAVSRTKYKRLFDAIAGLKTGVGITSGSNVLRISQAIDASVSVGDTIEMTGVPANTLVATKSSTGTKIGTVSAAQQMVAFRTGVIGTGYQISAPVEIDGAGVAADATVLSTGADIAASASTAMSTVSGANTLAGATSISGLDAAVAGCYVYGTGIPANARLVTFGKRVTPNAGTRTGSNKVYIAADAVLSQGLVANTLVGRRIAVTGLTAESPITVVDNPEEALTGSWSNVSGVGLFGPWDSPDDAKMIVSRRFTYSGNAVNSDNWITAFNPKINVNGAVGLGFSVFFWQTGQTVPGATIERRIGNASGALPALTYITSYTADVVGTNWGFAAGVAKAFSPTASTDGIGGQYVTSAGGGVTNARITNIINGGLWPNTGHLNASPSLFMYPASGAVEVNQKVSGGSIPANTHLTAVGTDYNIPLATWISGQSIANIPVGADVAQYVVGRKMTGAGIVVPGTITSLGAEFSYATGGVATGQANFFFSIGAATAQFTNGRYVSQGGGLPANTRVSGAPVAQGTLGTAATTTGSPNICPSGGVTFPANVASGMYVSGNGFASPARISSVVPSVATSWTFAATSANAYVPVGAYNAADIVTNRGISGTGIGTLSRITGTTAETALGSITTTNGSTTVTGTGFTAALVGCYITGPGIAANVRVTAFVSATQLTISLAAGVAAGTGAGIAGGIVTMTPVSTSGQTLVAVTLAPYAIADAACTLGTVATGMALGATIPLSATATATVHGGTTAAILGAQPGFGSANTATGTDVTTSILGAVHTMSANATAANASFSVTFGRVIILSANATTSVALTSATFGAMSNLSATPTASDATGMTLGSYSTVGVSWTTNRNATGARVGIIATTSSANSASNNNTVTCTMGPYGTMDLNATATGTPQVNTGGYALLDAVNATSVVDTTFNFGAGIAMASVFVPNCSYDPIYGGTISCPNTSGLVVGQTIAGQGISAGTTVTSVSATSFTISAAPTQYITDAVLYVPANATVTTDAGTARFFPFGAGDGSTTFGIGLPALSGHALTVGGFSGRTHGSQVHTLRGTEGSVKQHNSSGSMSGSTAPLQAWGGSGAGSYPQVSSAPNGQAYVAWSLSVSVSGSVSSGWEDSSRSHPNEGRRVSAAKALSIYTGAAA